MKDMDALCEISRETFFDAFSHLNTKDNMDAYMKKAFSFEVLKNELANPGSDHYFLYVDNMLAGYFKINESLNQTDLYDPGSLELERIYVVKGFQSKGLGQLLMNHTINIAEQRGKSYIWLGVWEKNVNALRFYERNGFYKSGTHKFVMGDDEQIDYIMRKDLSS
jgi:ribosomal protein S18 acetylase RimI-like enzyme